MRRPIPPSDLGVNHAIPSDFTLIASYKSISNRFNLPNDRLRKDRALENIMKFPVENPLDYCDLSLYDKLLLVHRVRIFRSELMSGSGSIRVSLFSVNRTPW